MILGETKLKEKPNIAVVIAVRNSMFGGKLQKTIDSLYESTSVKFKLILVEGGSNDGTDTYVDKVAKEHDNVDVHHIDSKSFMQALNYGLKQTKDEDVYITQDDVIHFKLFGRDWLMDMFDASQPSRVGVVTGLKGGGVSDSSYVPGMPWVGTWNMYLPRKTINKVGYFDENMGPGDDIDYSYRLGQAGLSGAVIDYWVQHHRLGEHGDVDSEKKQTEMAEYFRKKWKLGEFKDA